MGRIVLPAPADLFSGVCSMTDTPATPGSRRKSAGKTPAKDAKTGWLYEEFGLDFARKFNHLYHVASQREDFPKHRDWGVDARIAEKIEMPGNKWSNLRSAKPPKNNRVQARQLVLLANLFKLDEAVGPEAWRLFLPDVTLEGFEIALRSADYGCSDPARRQKKRRYIIPRLKEYVLRCPATLDEYNQTVELTKEDFEQDLIDLEADRQAFLRNPYPMVVLNDFATGEVIGWVDLYHLPDEAFEAMTRDGKVQIDPSQLKDFPDFCRAERGYTASIRIHKEHRGLVRLLVYGMLEFLLRFQFVGTDRFELFAIGQTPEGQYLLEDLKFTLLRQVQMEAGTCNLYSRLFIKPDLIREKRNFGWDYGIFRASVEIDIKNPLNPDPYGDG